MHSLPKRAASPGWIGAGLVFLTALLLFLPVVGFELVAVTDDEVNIFRHHHDLLRVWTEPYAGLYIPLVYTVWTALWKLQVGAWAFHALNVLLHAVSAVLVWAIARPVFPRGAVLAALFFAVSPYQVEPVAWVTGLKDVLSGALVLGAVAAHQRERTRWAFYLGLAAVLAKPTAVVFIALAWVIRPSRDVWKYAPAVLPLVASFYVQQATALPDFTLQHRVLQALQTAGYYLTQAPSADHWVKGMVGEGGSFLFGLAVLALAAAGPLKLGARVYLVALLPTLGLVPYAHMNWSTVADRYGYVAMAGAGLMLAAAVARAPRALAYPLAFVLTLASAHAAFKRLPRWRSAWSLYFAEVYTCPPRVQADPACGGACVDIPPWAYTAGFFRSPQCGYYVKPNSAMILGILHRRAGNESDAELYFHEARMANEWKESQIAQTQAQP